MRLPGIVKQDDPRILCLFQQFFGHRYVLDVRIEDVVDDEDILVRLSDLVIIVNHFAADDAERDRSLLIAD